MPSVLLTLPVRLPSGWKISSLRRVFAVCTSYTTRETAFGVEDIQSEESLCRLYFLHYP